MKRSVFVRVRNVDRLFGPYLLLGDFPLAGFLVKVETDFAGNVRFRVAALEICEHRVGRFVGQEGTFPLAARQL